MTIKIQEECVDGWFGCLMQVILSAITFAVITISAVCLKKVYDIEKRLVFEIMPLSTSLIQAILQFIMTFFYLNFVLMMTAEYMQSLTFAIITQSFAVLYFRMKSPQRQKGQRLVRLFITAVMFAEAAMFIVSLTGLSVESCNNWLRLDYFLPQCVNLIFAVLCVVFGTKLLNQIHKESVCAPYTVPNPSIAPKNASGISTITESTKLPVEIAEEEEDGYSSSINNQNLQQNLLHSEMFGQGYYERQKTQLRVVMWSFSLTWLMQLVCDIMRVAVFSKDIICEVSFTISTQNDLSNLFFFVYTLLQILPVIMIPYVFYYLPILKNKRLAINGEISIDMNITQDPSMLQFNNEQRIVYYNGNMLPPELGAKGNGSLTQNHHKKQRLKINQNGMHEINNNDTDSNTDSYQNENSINQSDLSFVYGSNEIEREAAGTNQNSNVFSSAHQSRNAFKLSRNQVEDYETSAKQIVHHFNKSQRKNKSKTIQQYENQQDQRFSPKKNRSTMDEIIQYDAVNISLQNQQFLLSEPGTSMTIDQRGSTISEKQEEEEGYVQTNKIDLE